MNGLNPNYQIHNKGCELRLRLGLDRFLEKDFEQYKGKRIGLVTNMTGVNEHLESTIDLFHEHPDIELTALFGPEHGIRGDAKEGEGVASFTDDMTGLPVFSLYGDTRKPTEEMMTNVDVMVFDLQDIGSRYYTYIYTMAHVMEACQAYGKKLIVLDRPNPISGQALEGNLVEEEVRSFIGLFPIPNRHGMTVGELAKMFKDEFSYDCDLTVIPMDGWTRDMYFDDTGLLWVPPSPNTTTLDMMVLYPGTCLVEGTNLSEGRGTTKPFEWVGAPFINGQEVARAFNQKKMPGVLARPISFTPTYQKYEGELCHGVQIHLTDRHAVHALKTGVALIEVIASLYPDQFEFTESKPDRYFFDLLAGTKQLKQAIWNQQTDSFFDDCEQQLTIFNQTRQTYLMYK